MRFIQQIIRIKRKQVPLPHRNNRYPIPPGISPTVFCFNKHPAKFASFPTGLCMVKAHTIYLQSRLNSWKRISFRCLIQIIILWTFFFTEKDFTNSIIFLYFIRFTNHCVTNCKTPHRTVSSTRHTKGLHPTTNPTVLQPALTRTSIQMRLSKHIIIWYPFPT